MFSQSDPSPPVRSAADEDLTRVDLREYLGVLLRRWWLILLVTAVAFGTVWWLEQDRLPTYTGEVLVQRSAAGSALQSLGLAASGGLASTAAAQTKVIKSRTAMLPVVDELGLRLELLVDDRVYPRSSIFDSVYVSPQATQSEFELTREGTAYVLREEGRGTVLSTAAPGDWLEGGAFRVRLAQGGPPEGEMRIVIRNRVRAADQLRTRLDVSPVAETGLLTLSYRHVDRQLVSQVVNKVAESYQRLTLLRAKDAATRRREFIESQLASVSDSLFAAQTDITRFQEIVSTESPNYGGEGLASTFMTLENNLQTLRFQETVLSGVESALRTGARSAEPFHRIAVVGADILPMGPQLYRELAELLEQRNRLTSSRSGYAANAGPVQSVDSLIALKQTEVREITNQALTYVRDRIRLSEERLEGLRSEISQVPSRLTAMSRLQQQVAGVEQVHGLLVDKYYEARIAEAVEAGDVAVVDEAIVPIAPDPSPVRRNLAAALIFGLLLGIGISVLLEYMDTKVHHAGQAERATGLQTLGAVPHLVDRSIGLIATEGNALGSEAFRTLRSMLRFVRTEPPKVLGVTSALPGEGKSFVAMNLAAAFAQQGSRVLLIDGDLRRPSVHSWMGIERTPGLSDVLIGDIPLNAAVTAGPVAGLSILACGSQAPNPAELLGSTAFANLIGAIRAEYEHVVIDLPPSLLVADPLTVGPHLDGMLLVARTHMTDRRALSHAVERLRQVKASLLGLVVNDVEVTRRYGYGSYYGGYYNYSYAPYGAEGGDAPRSNGKVPKLRNRLKATMKKG